MSEFIRYCANGNLIKAQEIYLLGGADINKAFVECCSRGHLEVAKWLHELGANIDLDDYTFIDSCSHGYIELAKWLYSIGYTEDNAYAFMQSCAYGKITVAKWLYEFGGIDIHAQNDCVFMHSCLNDHIEVAQWLQTLCDDYYLEVMDYDIIKYYVKNDDTKLIENKQYNAFLNKYNYKTIGNDETCVICYDNNGTKLPIECGHKFCVPCITKWKFIEQHNECPYCRQTIDFITE